MRAPKRVCARKLPSGKRTLRASTRYRRRRFPSPGGIAPAKRAPSIRPPRAPRFPRDGAFHARGGAPDQRRPRRRPAPLVGGGARRAHKASTGNRSPHQTRRAPVSTACGPCSDLPRSSVRWISFHRRPVVRKVVPRPHRTPHRAVQALDRVRRVDHPPDRLRKREERDHLRPVPRQPARSPGTSDPRNPPRTRPAPPPLPPACPPGRSDAVPRQLLPLLPGGVRQRIPDQVHQARLHHRLRKRRRRYRSPPDTLQPVHHRDRPERPAPSTRSSPPTRTSPPRSPPPAPPSTSPVPQRRTSPDEPPCSNHPLLADLHPQRVEIHDRIHRLQRPRTPLPAPHESRRSPSRSTPETP